MEAEILKNSGTISISFKVAKMRDSIIKDQDELIIRKSESEELVEMF